MNRPTGWNVCIPREIVRERPWIVEQEIALLEPDHWLDWSHTPIGEYPNELSGFTPMLWNDAYVGSTTTWLRMKRQPGETWLLFNEPERPEQANMTPTAARIATQEFLRTAWAVGEEFQWAAPGISINMDDYSGLDWATEYIRQLRRRGISRPTYWHVHAYRSNTVEQLRGAWATWLEWYATWGESAPVILSEVCSENAPIPQQQRIMDECREMLRRGEDGGVLGVYWFATHPTPVVDWPNACLCTIDDEAESVSLTPLGEYWKSLR